MGRRDSEVTQTLHRHLKFTLRGIFKLCLLLLLLLLLLQKLQTDARPSEYSVPSLRITTCILYTYSTVGSIVVHVLLQHGSLATWHPPPPDTLLFKPQLAEIHIVARIRSELKTPHSLRTVKKTTVLYIGALLTRSTQTTPTTDSN